MTNKPSLQYFEKNQKNKIKIMRLISSIRVKLWVILIVKNKTHKLSLLQARKTLCLLNTNVFRVTPVKFFTCIRKINALTFEEVLWLSFKERGYRVRHNKAHTGDGGFFIHTGKTGRVSYKNLNKDIVLIIGEKLHQFITQCL